MNSLPGKAVFLDRDGVINRKAPDGEYIRNWSEIQFIPGAVKAVASLNCAGYKVFVVTNQRGLATLRIKMADLFDIHSRMQEAFAINGAVISQIYYCPHDISAMCTCRKPQPGMLKRAAHEHNLDLQTSWMIGDSLTDVEAGDNAGCRTVLLASVTLSTVELKLPKATILAEDLSSAVSQILNLNIPGEGFVGTFNADFFHNSSS
jgi:D-glycero-D-manno-heptose 1,7-bisphosphate phosphatase